MVKDHSEGAQCRQTCLLTCGGVYVRLFPLPILRLGSLVIVLVFFCYGDVSFAMWVVFGVLDLFGLILSFQMSL